MRWEWDSNSRRPLERDGFQDRCFRPLSHPTNRMRLAVFLVFRKYEDIEDLQNTESVDDEKNDEPWFAFVLSGFV